MQYGRRPLHTPERVFAIGDVHNEGKKLEVLLEQLIPQIKPGDHVVFCGDLFNRGKEPALMIHLLVELVRKFPEQVFFVEGNHDWMLRNFLTHNDIGWMKYMGITLARLQEDWYLTNLHPATVAKALYEHGFKEIVDRMIPYYETEEVICTHAPLDLRNCQLHGIMDYEEDYKDRANNPIFTHFFERIMGDLQWQFTNDESETIPWITKYRICGHQPNSRLPRIFDTHAYIDTGCGKGKYPVTCFVYPSKQYFQGDVCTTSSSTPSSTTPSGK